MNPRNIRVVHTEYLRCMTETLTQVIGMLVRASIEKMTKVTETEAAVAAAGPGSSRIMALIDGSTCLFARAAGGSTATLLPGGAGCTARSLAGVEAKAIQ